jgi:hypothetical protein
LLKSYKPIVGAAAADKNDYDKSRENHKDSDGGFHMRKF